MSNLDKNTNQFVTSGIEYVEIKLEPASITNDGDFSVELENNTEGHISPYKYLISLEKISENEVENPAPSQMDIPIKRYVCTFCFH